MLKEDLKRFIDEEFLIHILSEDIVTKVRDRNVDVFYHGTRYFEVIPQYGNLDRYGIPIYGMIGNRLQMTSYKEGNSDEKLKQILIELREKIEKE